MTLILICSCGYSTIQESNDPNGIELDMLKGIHSMTFPEHTIEKRPMTAEEITDYSERKNAKKR